MQSSREAYQPKQTKLKGLFINELRLRAEGRRQADIDRWRMNGLMV